MARISLIVDGVRRDIEADADMPLLYALRGELALKGPKFGCGLAQCGACTVIIDGAATRSCVIPAAAVADKEIRTLDGLGSAANHIRCKPRSSPRRLRNAAIARTAGS